jgi:hypothetical protein
MRKSTMQKRKHTLPIYPGDQIAVVTMYPTGAVCAEGERGLLQVVCKYFAEEISQVLQETSRPWPLQKAFQQQVTHRKDRI